MIIIVVIIYYVQNISLLLLSYSESQLALSGLRWHPLVLRQLLLLLQVIMVSSLPSDSRYPAKQVIIRVLEVWFSLTKACSKRGGAPHRNPTEHSDISSCNLIAMINALSHNKDEHQHSSRIMALN